MCNGEHFYVIEYGSIETTVLKYDSYETAVDEAKELANEDIFDKIEIIEGKVRGIVYKDIIYEETK